MADEHAAEAAERALDPGTRVEVRDGFEGQWNRGFEVTEATSRLPGAAQLRPDGAAGAAAQGVGAARASQLDVVDVSAAEEPAAGQPTPSPRASM